MLEIINCEIMNERTRGTIILTFLMVFKLLSVKTFVDFASKINVIFSTDCLFMFVTYKISSITQGRIKVDRKIYGVKGVGAKSH